ncbi:MAG: mechanosensitive ion channel [Bacteroidales bacterium]|nr:mechanosensitive ion channel [Bacteroidales bacterium]
MEHIFKIIQSLIEPTIVLLILIILLIINSWIFKKIKSATSGKNIIKGTISFFLVLFGGLVFILILPIDKSLKGQILGFLGIIISAGIALSSTTVLGNLIAGIMNNSMNRFRNGDLIKIGDFHGRVIKKSIFHSEIQLEDSNFITIPNLYIANNPVKLIRKTNSVISASVSLGYDISRDKIEKALKDAAISAGLSDPYVYITSLGDFSVVYKIHGFLEDSSKYFSTSSILNAKVMDKLHDEKIEIVSPTFMNQRRVDEKEFIPKQAINTAEPVDEKSPEDLIFDEAIKSEKIEIKKNYVKKIDKKQEVLKEKLKDLKGEKEIEEIKSMIKRNNELKGRLENSIKIQIERDKDSIE